MAFFKRDEASETGTGDRTYFVVMEALAGWYHLAAGERIYLSGADP